MMQNPQDPLAALRDIHLPDAVGWWPLAYGWWVLLVLGLTVLFLLWRWLRARRRGVLRFARLDLDKLEKIYAQQKNSAALLISLSELLRRVALARFPREQVASLHGAAWIDFLSQHVGGKYGAEFSVLEKASYVPVESMDASTDVVRTVHAVRHWIRRATP